MGKGGVWKTVDFSDISTEVKYTFEKHSPATIKGIPWLVCKNCGLVYLRNRFTAWSIKQGCNSDYHRDYNKIRARG